MAARIDFRLLHYKNEKADAPQFGLIAEEEAKVNPNLVVRDKNGDIYTVRHDAHPAAHRNQIDAAFVFTRTYFVSVHFLRDKMADSELKFFRSKLRALNRCGEAVTGTPC